MHDEFALLDERSLDIDSFRDVQDEESENVPQRLYQIMKVVPKLVYEERLYYLVVEENSFRETRGCRYLRRFDYWELFLERREHLSVLVLEGAHYVLTSYDEVHDTSHYLSLREKFFT